MDTETGQSPPPAPKPLYDSDTQKPAADAPLRDLPPQLRPVFQALREACTKVPRVREVVRHEGPAWKWIWAYELDGYTLCAVHPMNDRVDLSFPLPTRFEPFFEKSDLEKYVVDGVLKGETAARVRYARVNVPDLEAVAKVFRGVELKLKLMAEDKK